MLASLSPGQAMVRALSAWLPAPPLQPPASETAGLPWAWQALQTLGRHWTRAGWQGQWMQPTPAGPRAPRAWIAMTHPALGELCLDVDPALDGQRYAWHLQGLQVRCVGAGWQDAARRLAQGPEALEAWLQQAPDAATPLPEPGDLPFDPLSRVWLAHVSQRWPQREAWEALRFDQAGQGLALDLEQAVLHPHLPLVAMANAGAPRAID